MPDLRKTLSEQKSQIYLSRGNNQKIPKLLSQLKAIDTQLRNIEEKAGRYGSLIDRKSEIDEELKEADTQFTDLNAQLNEIDLLQTGWDDWVVLSDCVKRLQVVPKYEGFPVNALSRLETLDEQIRQASESRDEAAERLRQVNEAATAMIKYEDLLSDLQQVDDIRRARSSFDNSVRDLPERQTELQSLKVKFSEDLSYLGHNWDEEALKTFDTSLVVRDQINTWNSQIEEASECARQAKSQLDEKLQTLRDLQVETQEAKELLPTEPPQLDEDGISILQNTIRTTRGRLEEYERQLQNRDNLGGQITALTLDREIQPAFNHQKDKFLAVFFVLAGVAFVTAGYILSEDAFLMGIVVGLFLLGVAASLRYMGRPKHSNASTLMSTALQQQVDDANKAVETAHKSLMESSATLNPERQPDAAMLDLKQVGLEAHQSESERWNDANTRLEDASRKERLQAQRSEEANSDNESVEVRVKKLNRQWCQWLRKKGLDETLTPNTMTTFLARVDTARSSLSEVQRMADRVAAIENDILEFQEQVAPMALRHSLPVDPDDMKKLASVADELILRLEEAQGSFSSRRQAKEQVEESRPLFKKLEERLKLVEQERTDLLSAGGVDDVEEFRRRSRLYEERQELERTKSELQRRLERLSGPGERFSAYRKSFIDTDPQQLKDQITTLKNDLEEVDALRNKLREERGGIYSELAQLVDEEESSTLRIRKHALVEQLRVHARRWSCFTIAEVLLDKTQQRFEKERQPKVIQHAQEFFINITGQRYQRLYAPIGEQTITVSDANGVSRQPHELSRGTREQLYLALRFGLIREFGEHSGSLPVVVDEALVNFDPDRARMAAQAFAELSVVNQVLVFTCHPYMRDMFAEGVDAQVVNICD